MPRPRRVSEATDARGRGAGAHDAGTTPQAPCGLYYPTPLDYCGQPPPAALPPSPGRAGLKQKLGWRVLAPSAGVEAEERSAARSAYAEKNKAGNGRAGKQDMSANWPRLA